MKGYARMVNEMLVPCTSSLCSNVPPSAQYNLAIFRTAHALGLILPTSLLSVMAGRISMAPSKYRNDTASALDAKPLRSTRASACLIILS